LVLGVQRFNAGAAIDHIRSTAAPGLAAKDVIDFQAPIADPDSAENMTGPLMDADFRQSDKFVYDEFWTMATTDSHLQYRVRNIYDYSPRIYS